VSPRHHDSGRPRILPRTHARDPKTCYTTGHTRRKPTAGRVSERASESDRRLW